MFKFNIFSFSIFLFISFVLFLIMSCCVFIPIIFSDTEFQFQYNINEIYASILYPSSDFLWPTPGYKTITSSFGKRSAPTSGASSYHSGIDIAAPARYKYSCYN